MPDTLTSEAVIRARHAELADQLASYTSAVLAAARSHDGRAGASDQGPREHLHHWCSAWLLTHIVDEERGLYSAASEVEATRLLTCGLQAEHQAVAALVAQLALARDPFEAAVAAASLQAVFTGHLAKEDDLLLPALTRAGISLPTITKPTPAAATERGDGLLGDGRDGCGHDHAIEPLRLTIPTRSAPLAAAVPVSEATRVG